MLRVITYNLLDGFTTHPGRREKVARWLAAQRPDVAALQELNGYTEDRLRDEARQWGHPHAALLKRDGYPTGLTSRTPIRDVQRVVEGYHHGVLHGRTAGIAFLVVHLSPHEYRVRKVEAERIAAWAERLMADGREVVVLGDFNSLSPVDRPHYEASGMLDHHRGRPESREDPNLNEGLPDFSVHRTLLEASLVDVVAAHTAVGTERITCATPLIRRPETDDEEWERGLRRVDFILAGPGLAARCVAGRVANDPSMDGLSDHYPVIADFET